MQVIVKKLLSNYLLFHQQFSTPTWLKVLETLSCSMAFQALKKGYVHWASGRINKLEIQMRRPNFAFVLKCGDTINVVWHIFCEVTPKEANCE